MALPLTIRWGLCALTCYPALYAEVDLGNRGALAFGLDSKYEYDV